MRRRGPLWRVSLGAHPEWSEVPTRHFAEQPGTSRRWPVPSRRDACGDVLAEQHLTRPGLQWYSRTCRKSTKIRHRRLAQLVLPC